MLSWLFDYFMYFAIFVLIIYNMEEYAVYMNITPAKNMRIKPYEPLNWTG